MSEFKKISKNGMGQDDLVSFLNDVEASIEELNDDHAIVKTQTTEIVSEIGKAVTDLGAVKTFADLVDNEIDDINTDRAANKTQIDALVTDVTNLRAYLADGVFVASGLAITVADEKFKTTATAAYTISGLHYTKAAEDNLVFSAAHTINTAGDPGDFFGAFLVQVDSAGTVTTKVVSADQVYASAALAIAALPAADAGNAILGYITVGANNGASWTANTDDMTPASDCQSATFVDATLKTLSAITGTVADAATTSGVAAMSAVTTTAVAAPAVSTLTQGDPTVSIEP